MNAPKSRISIKITALEILSEPLSLLILLAALTLTVFAPYIHFHQFGEPTRMARDAGLSSIFTCGSALAIFATIRSFRREIESGTLEMALAHPISRAGFFLAKTLGAFAACAVMMAIVFGVMATVVIGADVGGRLAAETGDLPVLWGPAFASGVGVLVLPLAVGALLNRFGRFRFVLTAFVTAFILAALSAAAFGFFVGGSLLLRLLPAALLLVAHAAVLVAAAAAFSVRFAANAASALALLVFAGALPFAGNYYLAESLSRGGAISWSYVGLATLAAAPAVAAFLLVGCRFSRARE